MKTPNVVVKTSVLEHEKVTNILNDDPFSKVRIRTLFQKTYSLMQSSQKDKNNRIYLLSMIALKRNFCSHKTLSQFLVSKMIHKS